MQNRLLEPEGELPQFVLSRTSLSFRKFVEHLATRIQSEHSVRTKFYRFAQKKFSLHPELTGNITVQEVANYEELLELVYASLLPFMAEEKDCLWGLSMPLVPRIFYGTDSLYELFTDKKSGKLSSSAIDMNDEGSRRQRFEIIYSALLERAYNITSIIGHELIHFMVDPETNLPKYYRINIDPRFIDVQATGPLPELSFETLQQHLHAGTLLKFLQEFLPLSLFRFEGFSVITLTDVTSQYAIEKIKGTILNRPSYNEDYCYNDVIQSLKTLCANNDIEFGLMPMLRINGRLIFNEETCLHSVLIELARKDGIAEDVYLSAAERYSENPELLFFRKITGEEQHGRDFLKILKQHGIQSYAMLPVFYSSRLAGVLEAYSKKENTLNEKILAKLELVIPLLSQLMQNSIDEFDKQIDNIIKDKFTSLQPAVYWKFNATAWHYLRDSYIKKDKTEVETVFFENVYPLYGAIDIRNSTTERNNVLCADLKVQFKILIETLTALKKEFRLGLIDEKIFKCRKWLERVSEYLTSNDEINLENFLDEIHAFLQYFRSNKAASEKLLTTYFQAIDEKTGIVYENRRALETSMRMINTTINDCLESFKVELQASYPCYFEKFRTDGIEYDIYIGQSIAPAKPFDILYLSNLRLWQLTSMAAITRAINALLPKLPTPMYVTQLIFVHANTIDISFRNDERRFDVEGTYNIRYQVIKKRIDKVQIRDTEERLTQPGKIALVYFNSADAEEYVRHINYLQEQEILNDDIEYLELEELQGVSGLKAIRVSVHLD